MFDIDSNSIPIALLLHNTDLTFMGRWMSKGSEKEKDNLKQDNVGPYNADSFNRLVLENQEKIYSLFRRMVASHDDADDLTQETFIKVYKNLSKFRRESAPFTWIYRIAVNTGINYLRRQKARQYIGLDSIDLKSGDDVIYDSELTNSLLQKAIKKISLKQQMVIILRSYQGLSFKEVAYIMDSTENAAKVNFSHALKNLKRVLENMGVSYESM